MQKKNSVPAKEQAKEKIANEQGNVNAKAQEKKQEAKAQDKQPQKSLEEMQADFERLKALFFRKSRFENALVKLKDYGVRLAESGEDIESEGFRIILSSGYNREDVKVNSIAVIADCINFLMARIESTIEGIEADILKG